MCNLIKFMFSSCSQNKTNVYSLDGNTGSDDHHDRPPDGGCVTLALLPVVKMATLAKIGRMVAAPLLAKRLVVAEKSVRCMASKFSQMCPMLLMSIKRCQLFQFS